jgi:hypothetical protein
MGVFRQFELNGNNQHRIIKFNSMVTKEEDVEKERRETKKAS